MKDKLQADLKDLANKIINDNQDSSATFLQQKARELYEKLTVLAFTEENLSTFSVGISSEEKKETKEVFSEEKQPLAQAQVSTEAEVKPAPKLVENEAEEEDQVEEKDDYLPDGMQYNDSDAITEPNTEMIKDIVAQMPPETQKMDSLINNIISRNGEAGKPKAPERNNDYPEIGVDYDNLPDFEPIKKADNDQRPRSLNDRLKNGINIGLNERLAFIRHLFEGKAADYNRVISQLNTFDSIAEARKFIQLVVKPDYKNWAGKEEYEQRFMDVVENKFKH